jgi:hypothetical protein
MSYSQLVWTSEPKTLDEHMTQFVDRSNIHFDYLVDTALETITRLNNGEPSYNVIHIVTNEYFMGEIILRWRLQKFLQPVEEKPPLVEGNITINLIENGGDE